MDSGFLRMRRRPTFAEDQGLASLADMEAGFSGKNTFFSTSTKRRETYKAFSPSFTSDLIYDDTHHFLDSCYLCKKPLSGNRDIFMYRGNTPFCSEECRQEQIEIDEAKENNWKMSFKAASRKEQQNTATTAANKPTSTTSKPRNRSFRFRAGTVAG